MLAFPTEGDARERALEQFGLDIEASLRGWFDQMGMTQERAAELVRHNGRGTQWGRPGRPSKGDEDDLTLTPRQREAVAYICCGYTRSEAAARMGVGMETAKRHLDQARWRLRATTLAHLVVLAAMIGELDMDIVSEHLLRTWDQAA